jgi:tRNA (adenine57-N1/adenine58-N1)-methyltransferase
LIKKLLIKKSKKVYLEDKGKTVTVSPEKTYFIEDLNKDYHCSEGVFTKEDLSKNNTIICSNKGKEFFIIEASFIDTYKGIRKLAQTIPLKDLGFILAQTMIDKKSIVVDAGAGSGGSACFIARYVKKVYTFDIDERNLKQVTDNTKYFGLKNIVAKKHDVYKSIPCKNTDLVILDLPEPWNAIDSAYASLNPGAFLVAYCPQIIQTQLFVNKCLEKQFLHIKTVEIVERDWKIEGQIVRPRSLSNIHSGFISIMRKIV